MASTKIILEGLYMLRELIPNWDITQQTVKVWELALKDLSDQQVTFAFEAYITHSVSDYNRIPRPGDLRKLVEAAEAISWDQAFEEIQAKAHSCLYPFFSGGRFHEVTWSTPDVRTAMYRMGGPEFFAELQSGNLNTARAQFRQVWENMERRSSIEKAHGLLNSAESHNIKGPEQGQQIDLAAIAQKMGMN